MAGSCSNAAARKGVRSSRSAASNVPPFGRAERIRTRADFQKVYQQGTKVHGRFATIFTLANDLPVGRLGIAATRKLGGAVQRNRAKRLIREVFRLNKIATGTDVVVVPKRELLDATLTDLETEYRHNLGRSLRQRRDSSRGSTRL